MIATVAMTHSRPAVNASDRYCTPVTRTVNRVHTCTGLPVTLKTVMHETWHCRGSVVHLCEMSQCDIQQHEQRVELYSDYFNCMTESSLLSVGKALLALPTEKIP